MAIRPFNQPTRITRTGTEFTLGRGAFTPEHGPIQDLGNPGLKKPLGPAVLGADEITTQFTVASGAAGTSQSFTALLPLPALPGFSPDTTDLLVLQINGKASFTSTNLTVAQESTVGISRGRGGKTSSGPSFPGGFAYSSWSASYSVTVVRVTALNSPVVMPVKIDAMLLLYSPKSSFAGNVTNIAGGVPIGSGTGGSGTAQGSDHGGKLPPGGKSGPRPL